MMKVISCLPGPERDASRVGVDCGEHTHIPGDEGKVPVAGEPLLLLYGSHQLTWEPEQFEVARSALRVPQGARTIVAVTGRMVLYM